jgi:hypothetical protein
MGGGGCGVAVLYEDGQRHYGVHLLPVVPGDGDEDVYDDDDENRHGHRTGYHDCPDLGTLDAAAINIDRPHHARVVE